MISDVVVDSSAHILDVLDEGPGPDIVVRHLIDDAPDVRHHDGAQAHHARLAGRVNGAFVAVLVQVGGRGQQRLQFGVRQMAVLGGESVGCPSHDGLAVNHDGPDRPVPTAVLVLPIDRYTSAFRFKSWQGKS